jgi:hypothetical protein
MFEPTIHPITSRVVATNHGRLLLLAARGRRGTAPIAGRRLLRRRQVSRLSIVGTVITVSLTIAFIIDTLGGGLTLPVRGVSELTTRMSLSIVSRPGFRYLEDRLSSISIFPLRVPVVEVPFPSGPLVELPDIIKESSLEFSALPLILELAGLVHQLAGGPREKSCNTVRLSGL